jgi:hypothetical protein
MSSRYKKSISDKTSLERDIERSITDLLVGKQVNEPIKVGKKIIQTGDSQTTITYELTVNPETGQQEVIERISTNKKECSTCGSYVSQLNTCTLCGKQVCGRHFGSVEVFDDYKHVVYNDWNDKDWFGGPKTHSREQPIYKRVGACSNCYTGKTGQRWEDHE